MRDCEGVVEEVGVCDAEGVTEGVPLGLGEPMEHDKAVSSAKVV